MNKYLDKRHSGQLKYTEPVLEKISAQKIEILHENLSIAVPATVLCSTLIYVSSYLIAYDPLMFYWYITCVVTALLRYLLPLYYLPNARENQTKIFMFTLGAFFSAALWGISGSVLLPKDNPLQQMVVMVIIAGISAGGLQTLQASFRISALSVITMILPLDIWLFQQHGVSYHLITSAIAIYLTLMLIMARRSDKGLTRILTLQYENQALVEKLSELNRNLKKSTLATEESENMLRNIVENAPIGMALISVDGHYLEVNHAFVEIIGYDKSELQSIHSNSVIYADDLTSELDVEASLLENRRTSIQKEKRLVHKNGELIWVLANTTLIRNNKGQPQHFIVQMLDISERKRNEMIMQELNDRMTESLDELKRRDVEMNYINKMSVKLQVCQTSEEAYSVISTAALRLFPSLSGEFILYDNTHSCMNVVQQWGKPSMLKASFDPKDCIALHTEEYHLVNDPATALLCSHYKTNPAGGCICLPMICQYGIVGMLFLHAPEEEKINENQQQLALAISELFRLFLINIQLREYLKEQSIRDSLTQLYNRRYLDEALAREIQLSLREETHLCIAMVDVDYFKNFNDEYGHEAGDEVLKLIGKLLKENVRGTDFACRYGGEEFIVVLINSQLEHSMERVRAICETIKGTRILYKGSALPQITISVGLAETPMHGITAEELIRSADDALYKAKEAGRDRIEVYQRA